MRLAETCASEARPERTTREWSCWPRVPRRWGIRAAALRDTEEEGDCVGAEREAEGGEEERGEQARVAVAAAREEEGVGLQELARGGDAGEEGEHAVVRRGQRHEAVAACGELAPPWRVAGAGWWPGYARSWRGVPGF